MRMNQVTERVIGCAMRVHSRLGPGLLESAYEACLAHELRQRGVQIIRQLALPVVYDGLKVDAGYRIDLLVEDVVVVEVKSIEAVHPVHRAQVLSYLRLSGRRVGLLLNFNVIRLRDGIERFINDR